MSVTVRQTWVGFFILFLVALLVLAVTIYWHHITGVNPLHLLAYLPNGDVIHGC
jgi:hypothetical protein